MGAFLECYPSHQDDNQLAAGGRKEAHSSKLVLVDLLGDVLLTCELLGGQSAEEAFRVLSSVLFLCFDLELGSELTANLPKLTGSIRSFGVYIGMSIPSGPKPNIMSWLFAGYHSSGCLSATVARADDDIAVYRSCVSLRTAATCELWIRAREPSRWR